MPILLKRMVIELRFQSLLADLGSNPMIFTTLGVACPQCANGVHRVREKKKVRFGGRRTFGGTNEGRSGLNGRTRTGLRNGNEG